MDFNKKLELTTGTYTVKEVGGLLGYTPVANDFSFSVKPDGTFEYSDATLDSAGYTYELSSEKEVLTLTVKNKMQPLALEFQKIDSHTRKPLEGVTFEIAKQNIDGMSWNAPEVLTHPDGNSALHQLNTLEPGKYKIYETVTPDGYRTVPGHIVLDVDIQDGNEATEEGLQEKGKIIAQITYYDNEGDPIENSEKVVKLTEITDGTTDEIKLQISFNVENEPTFPLPTTGGNGRNLYFAMATTLFGLVLLLALCAYLRSQRRN